MATERVPEPGFFEGTEREPEGGFEFALAERLAERFGLGRVAVVVIAWEDIVAGELGGADLALSRITPTSERDERLDFSDPYFDAAPTALVRAGTELPDLEAAQGLTWGAPADSTLVEIAGGMIAPGEPIAEPGDELDVIAALEAGEIDAALLDMPVAIVAARHSHRKLEAAAKLPVNETLAAALPEGSPNTAAVSSALRAFDSDGTLAELAAEWLGPDAADAHERIPLLHTTLR